MANPLLDEITKRLTTSQTGRYDPKYNQGVRGIQTEQAQYASDEEVGTRRALEDFNTDKSDMARQREDRQEAITERMANQGGSFSGVHVGEQGKAVSDYTRALGRRQTQYDRYGEDVTRNRIGAENSWLNRLNELDVGKAERSEAYAKEEAAKIAEAQANKEKADHQRQWMDDLTQRLITASQPKISPQGTAPLPTPQMQQQQVQQAVQQVVPPPPPPPPQPSGHFVGINMQDQPVYVEQGPTPPSAKDVSAMVLTMQQQFPTRQQVVDIQNTVRASGFDPGPSDGIIGPKTATAYLNYMNSLNSLAVW